MDDALQPQRKRPPMRIIGSVLAVLLLPGCAAAPITRSGYLASYADLTPSDGIQTKSLVQADRSAVLLARTVRILPTRFVDQVGNDLTRQDRALVANVIDRSLCNGLSERFQLVKASEPADVTVRANITQITATDEIAAGASVAAKLTTSALGVPGPTPRIPFGLGSLTIEAEALNPANRQVAAMIWARGAGAFFSSPKVSAVGDAYDLGSSFGDDFSYLLTTGETPFGKIAGVPSAERISSWLGGKAKYDVCESFGRSPGLKALLAGRFGLPPNWTDDIPEK
jgi:hypothetical protein